MYQTHWGLQESPFGGLPDPKFFYRSPTHDEALARLQFLVQHRRRLGLLVGPPGSGKSLVLEVFADQLRGRRAPSTPKTQWPPLLCGPVVKLSLLGIDPAEMLWLLATGWGLSVEPTRSVTALWRTITDRLVEYRYQHLGAVVLLDDADQASPEVLQHVTRLVRCDPSPETRLTVVLAGRNEAVAKLGEPLLGLADLRIDVEPWEPADTQDFLDTLLAQSGRRSPVFAEPAVARLHELSHGIPRRISQLADLALVAGAGQDLPQIDADVVEEAYRELGVAVS